jgi:chemotaxis methyl-accepting protein methylase
VSDRAAEALDEVVAVMREAHGLDVSRFERSFLGKSLEKRREIDSRRSVLAYVDRLREDRAEAEALLSSLRVVYSEFFRDPLAFALLERVILPALAEQKSRRGGSGIRVWSAGCAGGQEAWSVAMLLDELSGAHEAVVPFRVFATDLSEANLTLAHEAVYAVAEVGNIRLRHLQKFFARRGASFVVDSRLREQVDFTVYDLLDGETTCPPASIYGHFDLVLCCNVLIYYHPEAQRRILDKAQRSLAPGGYLITGETERQIVENAGGFRTVAPPAAVFQTTSRGR